MIDHFLELVRALRAADVRFVVIGVWGANYYARNSGTVFTTHDRDLFLPLDPDNELRAWHAAKSVGFQLWCGDEPLGEPMDEFLAQRIVQWQMLVTATSADVVVDFTKVMAGFDFETAWEARRIFVVDDVEIPVARLAHIVESKRTANREKDRLFLATHAQALADLYGDDDG